MVSHWDPWDFPAAYHTHAIPNYVYVRVRACESVFYPDSPDSYIDPTDLISSNVIPWALAHLPTKEHLCEPIRNAPATCSQVACPTHSMNSLSV